MLIFDLWVDLWVKGLGNALRASVDRSAKADKDWLELMRRSA